MNKNSQKKFQNSYQSLVSENDVGGTDEGPVVIQGAEFQFETTNNDLLKTKTIMTESTSNFNDH